MHDRGVGLGDYVGHTECRCCCFARFVSNEAQFPTTMSAPPPCQVEALGSLLTARTSAAADSALAGLRGGLGELVVALRRRTLALIAEIEVGAGFKEQGHQGGFRRKGGAQTVRCRCLRMSPPLLSAGPDRL